MHLFLLLCVGMLWGCTNTYMKEVYKNEKEEKNIFLEIISLIKNFKIVSLFLLNQLGSLFYYFLLARSDISLVMPLANTFTFVFTYLTELYILKKKVTLKSVVGLLLVSAGPFICSV